MTIVRVPTPLRPYTGGAKEVEVDGQDVAGVLQDLITRFPDLRRHLFDETGALRPYVNLFVNNEDVRQLKGNATPVHQGDRLMILPSIAGGAPSLPPTFLIDPSSRPREVNHGAAQADKLHAQLAAISVVQPGKGSETIRASAD